MKNVVICLSVVLILVACNNNNQNGKTDSKSNNQTEQKEIKKYSQEWLLNNLNTLGIEIPSNLTFDMFDKKGVKLKIKYKKDNVDSLTLQKLIDWQKSAADKFAQNGFESLLGDRPSVDKSTVMETYERWITRASKTTTTADSYTITAIYDQSTKNYELQISYEKF